MYCAPSRDGVLQVEAETKRHTLDVEEVHTVEAPCRRVHSPIGLYSPSWTYMGLDFSPQVAGMEGFYNPSLTCMP